MSEETNKKKFTQEEVWGSVYTNPMDRNRRPLERDMWEAVYNNDIELFIKTVIAGANIYYRDKDFRSPRDVAEMLGHKEIVKYCDDPVDLVGGSRWRETADKDVVRLVDLLFHNNNS